MPLKTPKDLTLEIPYGITSVILIFQRKKMEIQNG
jgi:hypothetical protein